MKSIRISGLRRIACAVLTLIISVFFVKPCALADLDRYCDEIPPAIRELVMHDNPDAVFSDCLLIKGTPRGDVCLLITPWWLYGYTYKDGSWNCDTQVYLLTPDGSSDIYFRRHEAGAAQGAAGLAGLRYRDGLGFDIVCGVSDDPADLDIAQFHWQGENFSLVGWQKSGSGELAILKGDMWAYYDKQSGEVIGEAYIEYLLNHGLVTVFDYLPGTLAQAKLMEAVTRRSAEKLFDGWTLSAYGEYNSGHKADASYYRIDNGYLTIRRAVLSSDIGGVEWQTDTMPVPLSQTLLARFKTEPFDTLINTEGYDVTFLTDDAFDKEVIPVTDKVLQNDLQTHGLILLLEMENGARHLRFAEQKDGGYVTRDTRELPADIYVDLFHGGDDEVSLEWDEHEQQCAFMRNADGSWSLSWYCDYGQPFGEVIEMQYFGIRVVDEDSAERLIIGTNPWSDMFTADFATFPATVEEASAAIDRSGWAAVNNPDPADRLHLRAKPDRASESLGKFYNYTPMRVLSQQGDWSHIIIGTDGRLDGWMLTKYLAFGSDMDAVEDAAPDKVPLEEYEHKPMYASPALTQTTGIPLQTGWKIIGVVGDELYILMDTQGNTGYMPQSWFFDGNG